MLGKYVIQHSEKHKNTFLLRVEHFISTCFLYFPFIKLLKIENGAIKH